MPILRTAPLHPADRGPLLSSVEFAKIMAQDSSSESDDDSIPGESEASPNSSSLAGRRYSHASFYRLSKRLSLPVRPFRSTADRGAARASSVMLQFPHSSDALRKTGSIVLDSASLPGPGDSLDTSGAIHPNDALTKSGSTVSDSTASPRPEGALRQSGSIALDSTSTVVHGPSHLRKHRQAHLSSSQEGTEDGDEARPAVTDDDRAQSVGVDPTERDNRPHADGQVVGAADPEAVGNPNQHIHGMQHCPDRKLLKSQDGQGTHGEAEDRAPVEPPRHDAQDNDDGGNARVDAPAEAHATERHDVDAPKTASAAAMNRATTDAPGSQDESTGAVQSAAAASSKGRVTIDQGSGDGAQPSNGKGRRASYFQAVATAQQKAKKWRSSFSEIKARRRSSTLETTAYPLSMRRRSTLGEAALSQINLWRKQSLAEPGLPAISHQPAIAAPKKAQLEEGEYDQLQEELSLRVQDSGLITEVPSADPAEGKGVDVRLQGNLSAYGAQALEQRMAVRWCKRFYLQMRRLWDNVPLVDGALQEDGYTWLYERLYWRVVARENGSVEECLELAATEWAVETGGGPGGMTWEMFYDAMFHFVDIWAEGCGAAEYCDFMEPIVEHVMVEYVMGGKKRRKSLGEGRRGRRKSSVASAEDRRGRRRSSAFNPRGRRKSGAAPRPEAPRPSVLRELADSDDRVRRCVAEGLSCRAIYRLGCQRLGLQPNAAVMNRLPGDPARYDMTELPLENAGLESLRPFVDLLRVNRDLKYLLLRGNRLDSHDVELLAGLLHDLPRVRLVDLRDGKTVGARAVAALHRSLRRNPKITAARVDGTVPRRLAGRIAAQVRANGQYGVIAAADYRAVRRVFRRLDANGDGVVTKAELLAFARATSREALEDMLRARDAEPGQAPDAERPASPERDAPSDPGEGGAEGGPVAPPVPGGTGTDTGSAGPSASRLMELLALFEAQAQASPRAGAEGVTLVEFLRYMYPNVPLAVCQDIVAQLEEQFSAERLSVEGLRRLFGVCDEDGRGLVRVGELKHGLVLEGLAHVWDRYEEAFPDVNAELALEDLLLAFAVLDPEGSVWPGGDAEDVWGPDGDHTTATIRLPLDPSHIVTGCAEAIAPFVRKAPGRRVQVLQFSGAEARPSDTVDAEKLQLEYGLRAFRSLAAKAGLANDVEVRVEGTGDVLGAIVGAGDGPGPDLIALSAEHTGTFCGLSCDAIVAHSPAPVLFVRGRGRPGRPPGRMLVVIDGSPVSLGALRYAMRLAPETMTLVPVSLSPSPRVVALVRETLRTVRGEAGAVQDTVVPDFGAGGGLEESVRALLEDLDVDFVVLGTASKGGTETCAVTSCLIDHADCHVLFYKSRLQSPAHGLGGTP